MNRSRFLLVGFVLANLAVGLSAELLSAQCYTLSPGACGEARACNICQDDIGYCGGIMTVQHYPPRCTYADENSYQYCGEGLPTVFCEDIYTCDSTSDPCPTDDLHYTCDFEADSWKGGNDFSHHLSGNSCDSE